MRVTYQQLKGPFLKQQELSPLIILSKHVKIFKIGICTKPGHQIYINKIPIIIGKTGMLEVRRTFIDSLYFSQDEEADTYIDIMAE